MKKYNVLIFPAGGENAINIHDSLKYNIHFNLFGASSLVDYGKELYPKSNYCIENLYISDENFINRFNDLINKFQIDLIIPTHDTIALFLMENEKNINAKIVCSPLETTRIAHSKKLIFDNLKNKFYCPKIYNNIDEVKDYPVFLKPNIGAGGKGTYLAKDYEELFLKLNSNNDLVICENLPGDEITVDCFTNFKRQLLFVGPRTRERITMGISFESKTIPLSEEIEKIAIDLNNTFVFRGAWFFQLKRDINGKYKLMEFSVRQAGTMALYRTLGINFALLSLFDALELDTNILYNKYDLTLSRRLKNSYNLNFSYDNIYIDFDDTLIINNKVNSKAMAFIYQCLNKNKKIYLISKHSTNIYDSLKKYKIDKSIFDEIIIINELDSKSDFIKHKKAIFIDNYYKERKEVFEKKHIPVFDVDVIENLIDYSDI